MKKESSAPEQIEKVATKPDSTARLSRLLAEEGDKIREKANQESSYIVAKAREEYKLRLTQFLEEERLKIRQEAETEAAGIITKANAARDGILRDASAEAQYQIERAIIEVKKAGGKRSSQIHR